MAEYMNKETFLASMGLRGDETKYGNRDGEHQHRSYSTYMSYEIMDCVEDSIEEGVVPVVRCKDCKHGNVFSKNRRLVDCPYYDDQLVDFEHFCSHGERRADNGT